MSKHRVAIIGAGASGLTSIKQCIDDGFEPVCFEESGQTGGLWKYTEIDDKNNDPHSSIYKTVIINTSKEVMTFTDFPVPYEWPSYLHNKAVAKYFDMYLENFNLLPYIRLNSHVQRISIRDNNQWTVNYLNENKEECDENFDYVMVCTGHHRYPRLPKYEGMDAFPGKQMHSHFYRRASDFDNKRVIVVGCGNSGMDISVELSGIASQVYLCARRGTLPWILPRLLFGNIPIDHLQSRINLYIPLFVKNLILKMITRISVGPHPKGFKPKSEPTEGHPTVKTEFLERVHTGTIICKPNIKELRKDNSIEFVDGSVLEDIDVIIYATGYNIKFEFLDKEIVNGSQEIGQQFEEEYRENLVWLYKYIFPPNIHNIAFIGLVQSIGALMPVSDIQAQYVTSFWKGLLPKIPSPAEMDADIRRNQREIRKHFYRSARHTIEAEMYPYLDELTKEIGSFPSLTKILMTFGPSLWGHVLFGIPTPIQYRLFGRFSWKGASQAITKYNGGPNYKPAMIIFCAALYISYLIIKMTI
ncbi:8588_t:CDS:2 [Funneliformis geosporum]|uniref:Flavin-containing monooxygenase 1 n=1 Tax=Funneliformis geosporum TaxID=1117311 RepID=A0A9W4SF10_9GLOM|nr:8588_t:CDS:2 [Funneliformis geosporum]CAI2167074.1 10405_t:CDS:2 [Funneliformis geosporum]